MREILFKGKRIDNGEWVYGDLIRHYENQRRFIACDQLAYTYTECGIHRLVTENAHEVIPSTIGQYTGLTDKNGTKVFEGDVMKNVTNPLVDKEPFWIEWDNEMAWYVWKDEEQQDQVYQAITSTCEVIGNIHDKEGMK